MFNKTPRQIVILLSAAIAICYLTYRLLFTLNLTTPYAAFASVFLFAAEIFGVVGMLLFFFQVWDTYEPPQQPILEGRTVDVFVPTYNETPDLLRTTLAACVAMDYPHRTYLCDDGGTEARVNNPEKGPAARERAETLKALCAEVGAIYLTRPDNSHAKAGNLNHAFDLTDGEFIIIFDADHVPDRHFITRLIGYFAEEKLAFVQTPHAFYNFDSFQARVNHAGARYWEEGQLFYHVIQTGRNRWNAAIFAGSAAMFRRKALEEVGYIAYETITEDMHTGLRMHSRGWKSLAVSERMISGQAAQDVTTFHSQRLRWGEGNLSVMAYDSPLTTPGLSLPQRLCYMGTVLNWCTGLFQLAIYLTPLLMLFTGIPPVREFTWTLGIITFLYMVTCIAGTKIAGNGYYAFWYSELFSMASFWTQAHGAYRAVFRRGSQTFVVTLKRGRQSKSIWPDIRPQVILIFVSLLALCWPWGWLWFGLSEDRFKPLIASGWTLFHMLLAYLVVRRALSPDDQRSDTRHIVHLPVSYEAVLPDGQNQTGVGISVDLNERGISLATYEKLPGNSPLRLTIQGAGESVTVDARIVHDRSLGRNGGGIAGFRYGLSFEQPTPAQTDALLSICLHFAVPHLYEYYRRSHQGFGKQLKDKVFRLLRHRRYARRYDLHLPVFFGEDSDPVPAVTHDVSRQSLAAVLPVELPVNSVVPFQMVTPLGWLRGTAKVVRNLPRSYAGRPFYYCALNNMRFQETGHDVLEAVLAAASSGKHLQPIFNPSPKPRPIPMNKPLLAGMTVAAAMLLLEFGLFRWVNRDEFFLASIVQASAAGEQISPEDMARLDELNRATLRQGYPTTERLVLLAKSFLNLERSEDLAAVTLLLAPRDRSNLDLQVGLANALDRRGDHERSTVEYQRLLDALNAGKLPEKKRRR